MSLIEKIENLQKKPESIRRRILFASVIVLMFVIVIVWIFTLNLFSKNKEKAETNHTPFNVFGGLIKDVYDVSLGSIKEAVEQLKNQFENGIKE